jgi:hypothetical protein
VTKSANDRAAQANLNTSLINAKSTFEINGQSYALGPTGAANVTTNAASFATTMASGNPSLSYGTGAVTSGSNPSAVSVSVAADGNGIVLAEQAKGTNNCWYIIDNSATESTSANGAWSVTGFPTGAGTYYGEAKNAATCSAAAPVAVPASNTPPTVIYQSSNFPNL